MKIVKWSFGDRLDETYMESKELVIGNNTLIQIGQYEGLSFRIDGLGLHKSERRLFKTKFLQMDHIVNIYLGKLIISHDNRGYKENLSGVEINWEMELKAYIKHFINYTVKPNLRKKLHGFYSKALKKTIFRKKEIFIVERCYERPRKIKCDRLTAFQLASNYEADLFKDGRYLLSPLGYDWETNAELIVKHLGKLFKNFNLYGYSDWSDVEILK